MSIYMDKLPYNCDCCPCNDDCYRCGLSGDLFDEHDIDTGRMKNCKLKRLADVRENVRAKMDIIEVGIQGKDKIYTYACSNCGHVCDMQDNFCRHCGADMRGDNHD